MTKKEIIDGLKMTMELILFDPMMGETRTVDGLNGLDRTTYESCKGAIELLEQPEQDWIPVNEEMPPLRHDVWLTVFFHEKWNVTEGYRQDGEFMFWNHGRLESALDEENRVTAWKPKSNPYQPDAK